MVRILDNTSDKKVVDTIKDLIKKQDMKQLSFAVGYFYLNGWNLIKDDFPKESTENFLKILIGRELDYHTFKEIKKGYKLRLKTNILDDLNEVKNENIDKIRELYHLVKKKIINFKIYTESKLHSKLYLFIDRPNELKVSDHRSPGTAILGSSNFTVPGTLTSRELNSEFTQAEAVKELQYWFDDLWENHSEEFREDLIKIIDASKVLKKDKKNPIGKYVTPKQLFKYLSWIWLRGKIEPIEKEDILAKFQLVGVLNAIDIVSEYNGVIISDSVGLGKSFIGATILEEYIRRKIPNWIPSYKGYDNIRRVLLILPPALIKQWKSLLFKSGDFFTKNVAKKVSKDEKFAKYIIFGKESHKERQIGEVAFLSLGKFQNMDPKSIYTNQLHSEYDLILVDEAHKFRNNWTNRFKNIQALRYKIEDDPSSHRNKFILLTATPINNNIWDVFTLIKIFSDDNFIEFKKRNINVTELFTKYRDIKRKWKENKKEEGNLRVQAQQIKDQIFKKVIILRTRQYIMQEFGEDGKIKIRNKSYSFKDPIPDKIAYENKSQKYKSYNDFLNTLKEQFEDLEFAFTKLYSSGYVAFKKQEAVKGGEDEEKIMVPINAILEFLLAKRLESSIFGFERTLNKLAYKNDIFYNRLHNMITEIKNSASDRFLTKLKELCTDCIKLADKEDAIKDFEEDDVDFEERRIDPRLRLIFNLLSYSKPLTFLQDEFQNEKEFYDLVKESSNTEKIIENLRFGLDQLYTELKRDKYKFEQIKLSLDEVKKDEKGQVKFLGSYTDQKVKVRIPLYIEPKIDKLKELIYNELVGKKYIIFTQYKDTAKYLYYSLKSWIKKQKSTLSYLFDNERLKIKLVTGETDMKQKDKIIEQFAPIANNAPENINKNDLEVLISTETLSEGVNLQDADGVINFDLPWNPMRIVQRVGRVNRIGNEKEIFVKNFSPTTELETIIGILEKLSNKIKDITFLVGKEFYILSEDEEISPETFETKIKNLADAKMSQLEEISRVGDSKFFQDIDHKEEVAKFRLLNYVQNELKLRKDDYDEIKPLLKKKLNYYTLTDSNELLRIYELYRGKTMSGRYLFKIRDDKIMETTCEEFIKLWTTKESTDDIDISDLDSKINLLDKNFEDEVIEEVKGLTAQGGFIGHLLHALKMSKLYKMLDDSNIDKEKLDKLIDFLPFVEMNTFEIKNFKDYLIDSQCISKELNIKDNSILIEKTYDYLNVSKDTNRKLDYKILGWCF